MTVSSIEVKSGQIAGFGSGTPTVATSLVSTDRVVVIVTTAGTAGLPTVSGLGATWTLIASSSSYVDQYMYSATGITGGGTITISGISFNFADYVVHVIRSSLGTTPSLVAAQSQDYFVDAAGTVRSMTGVAASSGAFVIGVARVGSGAIDFPYSTSVPSSGWTTDYTATTVFKAISQQLSSGATVSLKLTSNASHDAALLQAIYDDTPAGPPPLTSTFVGWGNPIF